MFTLRHAFARRLCNAGVIAKRPVIEAKNGEEQQDELLMYLIDEEDTVSQFCTFVRSYISLPHPSINQVNKEQ